MDITKIQSSQLDCIKNLSISSGVGGIGVSNGGISFSLKVPESGSISEDNTSATVTVAPVANGKKATLNLKTKLGEEVDVSTKVELTRINDNFNYRSCAVGEYDANLVRNVVVLGVAGLAVVVAPYALPAIAATATPFIELLNASNCAYAF